MWLWSQDPEDWKTSNNFHQELLRKFLLLEEAHWCDTGARLCCATAAPYGHLSTFKPLLAFGTKWSGSAEVADVAS